MPAYKPMTVHLETARLHLQPWDESDAEDLCALYSERVNLTRTPTVERTRESSRRGWRGRRRPGSLYCPSGAVTKATSSAIAG